MEDLMASTPGKLFHWRRLALFLITAGALAACGGGGSSSPVSIPAAPASLALSYGVKTFNFSWGESAGATGYRLLEDIDGAGAQNAVVVSTSATTNIAYAPSALLHERLNAVYSVQACNSAGCSADSSPIHIDVNQAIGYFKASNTGRFDNFSGRVFGTRALALSADGNTLAVGAPAEDSGASGVNGDQTDNGEFDAGAVYVFTRVAGTWVQQAYLKASNAANAEVFGIAVALSADGNVLAVSSTAEKSGATGIDGDQENTAADRSGAVYVFARAGTAWAQQAYVKASNTEAFDLFGFAVALSGDGQTLAVGAIAEASSATGVGGAQLNNLAPDAGAVYVFTRVGGAWTQQAYIKSSNTDTDYQFGWALALSGDGNTLAVGASGESSEGTGVNSGMEASGFAPDSGAVYVFTRAGAAWTQQAHVKASNTDAGDLFGFAVALSADGNTLAAGAPSEKSNATGIGGNQTNNAAVGAGAAYVFTRANMVWTQQAYVKASNTAAQHAFGFSVALSGNGDILAVGAPSEDSNAIGVGGNQNNHSTLQAGAAYVFKRTGAAWSQKAYLKASNTDPAFNPGGTVESFGAVVGLSDDANTLAVGAPGEMSGATGINGNRADNSTPGAGAVYLY
jgi:hypothetical protein